MSPPSCQDRIGSSTRLTAAYVAGLIDGEGCLSVNQGKTAKGTPTYTARCDVGMTVKALPLLKALQAQYGGSVLKHREATAKWEAAWRWALTGNAVKSLCADLLPFLQLKTEQARLLMRLTPKDGAVIKALVMELNRKGPTTEETTGWFARRVGGRWLTSQRDLVNPHGWEEFSGTFPRSGFMRNFTLYRLQPLVRLTDATGSGFWGTPTSHPRTHTPRNVHHGKQLANQVAMLPTPQRHQGYSSGANTKQWSGANSLPAMARHGLWPTPTVKGDYNRAGLSAKSGDGLATAVGGALNPTWVSLLMGFPADWLELGDRDGKTASPE